METGLCLTRRLIVPVAIHTTADRSERGRSQRFPTKLADRGNNSLIAEVLEQGHLISEPLMEATISADIGKEKCTGFWSSVAFFTLKIAAGTFL